MRAAIHRPQVQRTLWIVTMCDLMALLVTFFVMIFATGSVPGEGWQAMAASLALRLNPGRAAEAVLTGGEEGGGVAEHPAGLNRGYLRALLEQKLRQDAGLAEAEVHRQGDLLLIALPGQALFRADGGLTDKAETAATMLAQVLGPIRNRIEVHGHAPAVGAGPATPWESGLAAADRFAAALAGAGYARPVRTLGAAPIAGGAAAPPRLAIAIRG